jgi:hypothetical protein
MLNFENIPVSLLENGLSWKIISKQHLQGLHIQAYIWRGLVANMTSVIGPGGPDNEKNQTQKSRETVPLRVE